MIITLDNYKSELGNDESKYHWIKINYKRISECFIRQFEDKLDWENISFSQKLSEEFIREFKDKVYWEYIFKNMKINKDKFSEEMLYFINQEKEDEYNKLSNENKDKIKYILEFIEENKIEEKRYDEIIKLIKKEKKKKEMVRKNKLIQNKTRKILKKSIKELDSEVIF